MKQIKKGSYRTNNTYKGYSTVNRYHWEVGFNCYFVDYSEDRADTDCEVFINDKKREWNDTYELRFFNYRGDVVRVAAFQSADKANLAVKQYIQLGFKRVA